MSARAVPFYCPYCGEEELVPEPAPGGTGEGHGHWACRACRRAFRLSLTALVAATPDHSSPDHSSTDQTSTDQTSRDVAVGTTARTPGSANGTAAAPSDVEETN
ncbi:hypothetical protein Ga0074812_102250 [Parafrankia irregularis]|uniref:Insertion element protein n=1 Tax=Parafrankia irregularis TaxID=795642 RepID=A0A0S4QFH7_9ACTN|nr:MULTISPECIES: hypothetical protein [Parafrankia]MBE3203117.1 hypothetical protein [Parafrankia sp. CH37]CUU54244.1 hypothetical protein Ga0074812_102250 [Parafrankia irregularis]